MSSESVIRMEHVGTRFGAQVVHRDINLSVDRGQIFGIVGRSGSGKTTLMREMMGLQQPSEGGVHLFGRALAGLEPDELAALHRRCGVLFQGGALFSSFNVFENIAFPLRESRLLEESLIRKLVCMKLGMVGLDRDAARALPAELSGGMVKRAALARALALEPELLLLDEPTSGLDPLASEEFIRLLSALHQELRFTLVMVTHDLDVMHDLCDVLAVLAEGRLLASGSPAEVRRSKEPLVREFFHGAYAERVFAAPTGPAR
ncbi:MAG TPA: ATP-binding cassette domain-containing protein [Gammaproteobacteria bacterium]